MKTKPTRLEIATALVWGTVFLLLAWSIFFCSGCSTVGEDRRLRNAPAKRLESIKATAAELQAAQKGVVFTSPKAP